MRSEMGRRGDTKGKKVGRNGEMGDVYGGRMEIREVLCVDGEGSCVCVCVCVCVYWCNGGDGIMVLIMKKHQS